MNLPGIRLRRSGDCWWLLFLGLTVWCAASTDREHEGATGGFQSSPDFQEATDMLGGVGGAPLRSGPRPLLVGPIAPAAMQPAGALSGRVVFTSAGHGWIWDESTGRWYTQRPMLNGMIEDYGNLDQMTMFVAYCFNAGATVVPLRPVGFQTHEVVLDNEDVGVAFAGDWQASSSTVFYGRAGALPYRYALAEAVETATAVYTPDLPAAGFYPVYTWVRHGADRVRQWYRVRHTGGESAVRVPHDRVGNGWVYLGTYYFRAGMDSGEGAVVVSNLAEGGEIGGVVIADAIRFGNGMGDIDRQGTLAVSGYPREEEAARYWVQASLGQGQSTAIYDTSGSDASDNVGAPPRMAREMNRESAGEMADRVYLGFHSNAGGGRGCVGLYNNNTLFPGTGTPNQFRWAQLVGAELNNDLVSLTAPPLEVPWHNRGANITFARSDFAFGEIRHDTLGGEMDASIIEVAFHDNADDARLMRDPKVRNAVARACYQATVRYMYQFGDAPLEFLPEPPRNVRARMESSGELLVEWDAPGAGGGSPSGYGVYLSRDGYGFGDLHRVDGGTNRMARLSPAAPGTPVYVRVAAFNAGGESFPSETLLAMMAEDPGAPRVLLVSGFDRFDRTLAVRQTAASGVGGPSGGSATFDRVKPREMNSFDYVSRYGGALQYCGVAIDSCANELVVRGEVTLAGYDAVIWILGEESSRDETFSASEQAVVAEYLDAGGALLVSGSEIAWDLGRGIGPSTDDRLFLTNYLHGVLASDADDDAATYAFAPAAGSIFAGRSGGEFDDPNGDSYDVDYPDILTPVGPGAVAALDYVGGREGVAAIQYHGGNGGARVVYLGFPFEAIRNKQLRLFYLGDALRFFGLLPAPRFAAVETGPGAQTVALTWSAVPGQRYQVVYAENLEAPVWELLGGPVPADSTWARLVDPDAPQASRRFYRVRLVD